MKKAIVKILFFTLLFVFVDTISGPVLMSLMASAKPSAMKDMYDITESTDDDIIILGSSRAMHHYDSRIIKDSMQMSCQNCGAMSNGIVLMYGRYKLLTRHHIPKMIVYDLHPPFDIAKGDNSKYIPTLRPFADDDNLKKLFAAIDKWENFKLNCNLYRFNSLVPELLAVNIREAVGIYDGYTPLYNSKEFTPPISTLPDNGLGKHTEVDSLKFSLFRELIADCKRKKIKLTFVISPSYNKQLTEHATPVIELCKSTNTPILFYETGKFPLETKYFYDSYHLNDDGVKLFTRMFVSDLKKIQNN